jgi:hypothetical protein
MKIFQMQELWIQDLAPLVVSASYGGKSVREGLIFSHISINISTYKRQYQLQTLKCAPKIIEV